MDNFIYDFVANASTMQKGVFLMVVGMSFVFSVQVIFFAFTKIWLKVASKKEED